MKKKKFADIRRRRANRTVTAALIVAAIWTWRSLLTVGSNDDVLAWVTLAGAVGLLMCRAI
ncbi:MAG: hypothetical protein AAFV33_15550 [Chloroflexota bacterium]